MMADVLQMEKEKGEMIMSCAFLDSYLGNKVELGIQQGIQQGEEKTRLTVIKNLMMNLKMTAEQAVDMVGIPKEEREKYLKMVL